MTLGERMDRFTGLRLGELCGLRWENVSMEHQVFQVCETRNRLPNYDASIEAATSVRTVAATKTENSRWTVYLLDDLFHDLESYKAIQDSITRQYLGYDPDGYVFCQENGQPYKTGWTSKRFRGCWGTTQRGSRWTLTPM